MKLSKINLIRIIAIATAGVALATCVTVGLVVNKTQVSQSQDTVTVDHIEITKQPTKVNYIVGETFSRSGMVVTAFYSDNSSKKVMNYTIDKTQPLTLEDTLVTITFKEKTAALTINVSEKQVETQLKVTSSDTYTYKVEAEDLPFASEELGTDKSKYYEYHNESVGNPMTSGGISLGNLNYSAENMFLRIDSQVEVKANIVIAMSFNPSLDFDDSIETKFNDQVISTGFTVSVSENAKYVWFDWKEYTIPNLMLKKGLNELSLRLKDTSKLSPNFDYLKLEVNPLNLEDVESIQVTSQPNKTEYIEGERFDKTGLVVSAVLKDGKKVAINDYSLNKDTLTLEDDKVTVNYKNQFYVDIPITVSRSETERLEIKSMPERTTYYMGEMFDKTGLSVNAISKQGTSQDITDFLTFDKTYLSKGDTFVKATYNEKSIDIPVSIDETTNLTIQNEEEKAYRIEAEDALFVKGHGNKEKYVVAEDANASGGKRLDSLDWLKGSSFMVVIDSKVETSAKLTIACDGPALDFASVNPMTFNGDEITLSQSPEGGWLNFKPYSVKDTLSVHKGINTFILNLADNQSFNFDYFEFLINPPKEEAKLKEIVLDDSKVKKDYRVGETFKKDGLIVTANYEDGTSKEVTDYQIDKTNPLTMEDTQIKVTYQDKSAVLQISVTPHMEITQDKSYRIEAEDALFEKGSGDKEKYTIVEDANASGGKRLDSLDWLKDSTFRVSIYCAEEKNATLTVCCDGGGSGGNISSFASIKVDDAIVSFSGELAGGWGNLQKITSDGFQLKKGINELTIKITGTASVNYDYFEINIL